MLKHSKADNFDMSQLENKSFILSMCTWSIMMMTKNSETLNTVLKLESIIEILKSLETLKQQVISDKKIDLMLIERGYVHIMRTLYFSTCVSLRGLSIEKRKLALEPISDVFELLKRQLSSPYHENRLNSLYVLNELAIVELEKKDDFIEDKQKEFNIFVNCLNAELTAATLDDYRQKLVYLLRLDHGSSSRYFDSMKPNELNFTDVC